MMATEVWDCEFIQKSNELQVSFMHLMLRHEPRRADLHLL